MIRLTTIPMLMNLIQFVIILFLAKKYIVLLCKKPAIIGRTGKVIKQIKKKLKKRKEKKMGKPKGGNGGGFKSPKEADSGILVDIPREELPGGYHKHDTKSRTVIEMFFTERGPQIGYIKFIFQRYYNRKERKIIHGTHPFLLPGMRHCQGLIAWIVHKRIMRRQPLKEVKKELKEDYHITITDKTVLDWVEKLATVYRPVFLKLLRELRKSKAAYADETGAPMNGKNGWVWAFSTISLALFFYDKSRGHKVPERILKGFKGVLSTDFWSAYNCLDIEQQKCLVHLLRILERDLSKNPKDKELKKWLNQLVPILEEAIKIGKDVESMSAEAREATRKSIEIKLQKLISLQHKSKVINKEKKTLKKHFNQLFVFITNPLVKANTNFQERLIRHFAVFRKIATVFRSPTSLNAHLKLLSLLQTCKLRDKNPLDFLRGEVQL